MSAGGAMADRRGRRQTKTHGSEDTSARARVRHDAVMRRPVDRRFRSFDRPGGGRSVRRFLTASFAGLVVAGFLACGGDDPSEEAGPARGTSGASGKSSSKGGSSTFDPGTSGGDAGTPGSGGTGDAGTAGAGATNDGTGGDGDVVGVGGSWSEVSGSGGSAAGTGGSSAGTGGSAAGTGGSAAGTGGSSAGTGGSAAGTGGSSAGTGGSSAGTGGSSSCAATETCGNGIDDDCDGDVDETCTCSVDGPVTGLTEGSGLRSITAKNFTLVDANAWTTSATRIAAWKLPTVSLATIPLNRTANKISPLSIPDYNVGFAWESGDAKVAYWVPQGLAGGVSGTRKALVAAWYYDTCHNASDSNPRVDGTQSKGVRVSFVDVTEGSGPYPYRHLLLVEPTAQGFQEVDIHAGGLAWVGHYLYVVDSSHGLRVFDLNLVKQVSDASVCADRVGLYQGNYCAAGYSYVVPQVDLYALPKGLPASCRPTFSGLGRDLTTSGANEGLVTAEYRNDSLYGRLFRWPLGTNDRLATDPNGVVHPSAAYYLSNRNIQGAVGKDGNFWMAATRYCGSVFYGKPGAATAVHRFDQGSWGPLSQGMHLSSAGNLWTLTEGEFARACNAKNCSATQCAGSGCTESPRIVYAVKPAP
jgi:hypothetical protein